MNKELNTINMTELLDQVTLIVTVRGRCAHVRRVLEYYTEYPIRVLLLDSSDKPCKIKRHPVCFEHLHMPQTHLMDAMIMALSKVKTPYCVNAPDDDFFIPSAIAECVQFLNVHTDYQCVQGHYARFMNGDRISLTDCYPHMAGYNITSDAPDGRLAALASYYVTWHHGVHRTAPSLEVVKASKPVTNLSANEFVTASLFAIEGKSAVIPVLFCIREHIVTAMSSLLRSKNYQPNFKEILENPDTHSEILNVCEAALLKGLSKFNISNEAALQCIHQAFDANRKFRNNFSAEMQKRWDELPIPKPAIFDDIIAAHDALDAWARIKVIMKKYDLDPLVRPVFVEGEGRTLNNWPFLVGVYFPQKARASSRRWRKKYRCFTR